MYSTNNEGKLIADERFIRTLKGKISRKIKADDSKSYLHFLNKLVDECNNNYHHYFGKKPVDANYSFLTEEIEADLTVWWS